MSNIFPALIISQFMIASIICFIYRDPIKGFFYLFSALINITVFLMK